eukprot:m.127622 g.127622  ORF g.127622 m.127622 type:complete len:651 (-) comp15805_c0_seq2:2027-3979(-)
MEAFLNNNAGFVLVTTLAIGIALRLQPYSANGNTLTNANAYHHANLVTQTVSSCASSDSIFNLSLWHQSEFGLAVFAALLHSVNTAAGSLVKLDHLLLFLPVFFGTLAIVTVYYIAAVAKTRATGLFAAFTLAVLPGAIRTTSSGMFVPASLGTLLLLLTILAWIHVQLSPSLATMAVCTFSYLLLAVTWESHVVVLLLFSLHTLYLAFIKSTTKPSMTVLFACLLGLKLLPNMAVTAMASIELTVIALVLATALVATKAWLPLATLSIALALEHVLATESLSRMTSLTSNDIQAQLSTEHQAPAWGLAFVETGAVGALLPLGFLTAVRTTGQPHQMISFFALGGTVTILLACSRTGNFACMASFVALLAALAMTSVLQGIDLVVAKGSSRKEKKTDPARHIWTARSAQAVLLIALLMGVASGGWLSPLLTRPDTLPSVTLRNNTRLVYRDFAEACDWLKHNTSENATLFSWVDHAAALSYTANRTVVGYPSSLMDLVFIAHTFVRSEQEAALRLRHMGVDYVIVTFGGVIGSTADDIGKFLWMVRAAQHWDPSVEEEDFVSPTGGFRISGSAPDTVKDSLLYKLSYYDFAFKHTAAGKARGWDRARKAEVGRRLFELQHFVPVFTSHNWLVRVYQVAAQGPRDTRFLQV